MNRSRMAFGGAYIILLALFCADPAVADHCGGGTSDEACVDGADEGFTVRDQATHPGRSSESVGTFAQFPQSSTMRRQTVLVPTCDGNNAESDIGLCTAAVATCPNQGDVRFWVYSRMINTRDRSHDPAYTRQLEPDSVCAGPDDPRVTPTVAIPAIIDRDFQRVVVLKGIARVTPAPDTLVNVETRFATDAPARYEIPLTVLDQSVVITASAASWTWHFGDGITQRLTDGVSGGSTVNEYRRSGPRAAYVVIEWTGTYVIGGDPAVRQVNGTATTIGEPAQIAVRTARSELVDQPG